MADGENTVKFVQKLQEINSGKKLLLIWDGASSHTKGKMRELLLEQNEGKEQKDWLITCELFAAYAPEENPVEGIGLPVKNFIRRFHYLCTRFSIMKKLFQLFFKFQLFNPPNLEKYHAFSQLI